MSRIFQKAKLRQKNPSDGNGKEKMKGHDCFNNKICQRSQFQEKLVKINLECCCSAVKSCLTFCNSIGLQQAKLPCPSLSPEFAQIHFQ